MNNLQPAVALARSSIHQLPWTQWTQLVLSTVNPNVLTPPLPPNKRLCTEYLMHF